MTREGQLASAAIADTAVEIRGRRVDISDVRAALAGLDGVDEAAVIAREDRSGDQRLVGYVVGPVDAVGARAALAERLPPYMAPAAIVVMDALPRTADGVIDIDALPAPESCDDGRDRAVRHTLTQIFGQVLGVEQVQADESFFDLGGDSLAAMRVIAAVNAALETNLPLGTLFNAPTVDELASRIGRDSGGVRPLVAGPRPEVIPLSFAQSRLWFISQLRGPSPVYNRAVALRLRGMLVVDALETAIGDVVGRHESLRTIITVAGGVPQQVVLPAELADYGWQVLDAEGWSADQLNVAIEETAHYSFDLEREIPLRACVFRAAEEEHVLVVMVHHIAGDGWSVGVLAADISSAYARRCVGLAPEWSELPVQYADYTLWQRQNLGDPSDRNGPLAAQIGFWEEALAGMPQRLELPTDRPYPLVADHRGATVSVDWPVELQQQVRLLARAHNATTFMVVQTALSVLLSRLSSTTDVAVGFPIAGRGDPALDALVGFFVNTLILRVDTTGNPSFADLLAQVRERSLTAYEHQDVPFEVLVEQLNPPRSLTHHPLIQVMLAWQNTTPLKLTVGDLEVSQQPIDAHTARMDLAFFLGERFTESGDPAGIGGTVEFRTDVYDTASIEALVRRLKRVLTAVIADPAATVSSVSLLDEAERSRVDGWANRSALTGSMECAVSIPDAFAAQVARTPGNVALRFGGTSLTYRELDDASNRLARLLSESGAGPGTVVALLSERSAQAVVAILAVVKAGAAYLPLDPALPDARLAFMLADAAPVVAVSTARLSGRLTGVAVVDIDDPQVASYPCTAPAGPAADDIAYLIYTSGTTGRPKGVAITHHNLTQLIMSTDGGLPTEQVWSQWHSFAFDFSVWEVWAALLRGGRLVVIPEEVAGSPADFQTLLVAESVNVLTQTPSAVGMLAPEAMESAALIMGGEACPAVVVDQWAPGRVMINA
uniref:condensation domain-containing protein n=1 Tax=Mycobacterium deserti TaxID=2978347 RepID=UPI0036F1C34E